MEEHRRKENPKKVVGRYSLTYRSLQYFCTSNKEKWRKKMNLIDFENQKGMRRGQRRGKSFEIYFDVSNTVLFLYQKRKNSWKKEEGGFE